VIVAVGFLTAAAVGAACRGLVLRHVNRLDALPWGTLAVNVSGSFALGLAAGLDATWLTVVGAGGLGAYTTFSTFALELVRLHEEHRTRRAVLYLVLMIGLCVAAAWLGLELS
jgi:CrcB protein